MVSTEKGELSSVGPELGVNYLGGGGGRVLRGETSGVRLMVSTEKGELCSVGPELGVNTA